MTTDLNLSLPSNMDAEQGMLGILLGFGSAIEDVTDDLLPEHFFWPAHERIYKAILEVSNQGMVASPVTLKSYFEKDGDLTAVGGADYLAALVSVALSPSQAKGYARIIRDLYLRRALITDCHDMIDQARLCDPYTSGADLLETMEARLFQMGEVGTASKGPESVSKGLDDALEIIDRVQKGQAGGLMTGISALDHCLGGFWPGDLIILAARPSMGKTAKALTLAHNVAVDGKSVLFFNLEMTAAQMSMRLLARRTGLPVQAMQRQGDLKDGHFKDVIMARADLARLPLHIDDTPGLSAAQIRTRARRHKRRHGLDLIIIDYLGLMTPPPGIGNKVNELAEITKALKTMAKELGVPIVLLHQLSRAVEGRDNKRPQLADLRDSGAIEQDADVVMFLYREEYYLSRDEPAKKAGETQEKFSERLVAWQDQLDATKGRAEAVIAKFRQGNCGIVHMAFNGIRQCFSDIDRAV